MSKYKVLTIAIAVKNNRIAKFGEKVDESELTINASVLVESGALELIEDKKSAKDKKDGGDNKPSEDNLEATQVAAVSSDADATAAEAKEEAPQKAPTAAEKAAEAAKK